MKIPKSPPNLDTILQQIKADPEQTAKFFDVVLGPLVENKYLHWDKLRYYTPPAGLSNEEWWFAIKKQRRSLFKKLPLKDKKKKSFQYLLIEPITEMLHTIDQSTVTFNQITDPIRKTETKNRYYVNTLIQEAFTSSVLEGATTTRPVAAEMIRTGRPPCDKSEQMILNNFLAMKHIEKLKDVLLSKESVFEIHRLVTERTLKDPSATGRFRKANERIVNGDMLNQFFHDPPPAKQLEQRMAAMCDFANSNTPDYFVHPVIRFCIKESTSIFCWGPDNDL